MWGCRQQGPCWRVGMGCDLGPRASPPQFDPWEHAGAIRLGIRGQVEAPDPCKWRRWHRAQSAWGGIAGGGW